MGKFKAQKICLLTKCHGAIFKAPESHLKQMFLLCSFFEVAELKYSMGIPSFKPTFFFLTLHGW